MGRPVIRTNGQIQFKSKQNKYLTFSFFDNGHGMELEFIGWVQIRSKPNKPGYIRGFIGLFGSEIPVIDLRNPHSEGIQGITNRSCIVIFRHFESGRCYFGMLVEELSNIINIADGTENKLSPLLLSAREHLSNSNLVNHQISTARNPFNVN